MSVSTLVALRDERWRSIASYMSELRDFVFTMHEAAKGGDWSKYDALLPEMLMVSEFVSDEIHKSGLLSAKAVDRLLYSHLNRLQGSHSVRSSLDVSLDALGMAILFVNLALDLADDDWSADVVLTRPEFDILTAAVLAYPSAGQHFKDWFTELSLLMGTDHKITFRLPRWGTLESAIDARVQSLSEADVDFVDLKLSMVMQSWIHMVAKGLKDDRAARLALRGQNR